jgi:DmsE family decaheme c-type cytochrome
MPSHHPLKEGGMGCVSCHDPHGSQKTNPLSRNEQCFKCHQSVRGPKAFEHSPVTEDCGNCHNPHGSPNGRLLTVSEPVLCLQCHVLIGKHKLDTDPLPSTSITSILGRTTLMKCTNCHAAVHGSHADPLLKR